MRWNIALQPYVFTIHHRKCAENSNAHLEDGRWSPAGEEEKGVIGQGQRLLNLFLIVAINYFVVPADSRAFTGHLIPM